MSYRFVASLFLSLLTVPVLLPAADRPPNIIYILADDLGYGDVGCYGQKQIPTPHIDRLAAEGMRFTQHYSGSAVCGPSRSALLEGRHTGHTAVRSNKAGQLLDPSTLTLPEALKTAGYTTAIMGKWGAGEPPPPDDPGRHGFDHAFGYVNMFHAHNFFPEFLIRDGQKVPLPGNVTDHTLGFGHLPEGTGVAKTKVTYAPYEIERETLAFIEAHRAKPFFLYVALNLPHNNGELAKVTGDGCEVPDYGEFATRDWPQVERGFARMVQLTDRAVGLIMARLKELGLEENTLVVFSSDNGPYGGGGHNHEFFNSNGELRGYKRALYEGGIRVPFIARWTGKIKPASTSHHVSAMWDLYPTFCELAGAKIPAGLDGLSLAPTLLSQGTQAHHEHLYWEFYEGAGAQAVRQGDWKAVRLNLANDQPEVFELYNLATDPSETRNLAAANPEIARRLRALMSASHRPHPICQFTKSP
jgi:arylsulfatase A-like enzyme